MRTIEPIAHDYREAALTGTRGILQDKKNPDGTIEVIVTETVPQPDERVLLTISGADGDKQTAWRVVATTDVSNHNHQAARLVLRFEGIIVED